MESEEKVSLERQSFFLPVIIIPYYERSHTASIIGWKDHKPRILKDVKASFAGKVWLTPEYIRARSFLLWSLLSIKIPVNSITSVKVSNQDNGLIEIGYRQAEMSRLLQHLTKGAPGDIVLLKLDDMAGNWLQALGERLG